MTAEKQNITPIVSYDFEWVFDKNTELAVIDPRYKSLLREMYVHSTSPFLILREDEEYILKKYKLIRRER